MKKFYAIEWEDKSCARELYHTKEAARLSALMAAMYLTNHKMKAQSFTIIEMFLIPKRKRV